MVEQDNLDDNVTAKKAETQTPSKKTEQIEQPRRKKLPPAPPPPRISGSITDRIALDNQSAITSNYSLDPSKACIKQNERSPNILSPRLSRLSPSPSPPILTPHPPSSPHSDIDGRDEGCPKESTNSERYDKVVESVSSLVKTARDDPIAKCMEEMNDLTKLCEQKTNALVIRDEEINDLRKKVDELSHDKLVMVRAFDEEKQRLQGQISSLQMEITKMKDENEAAVTRASELSSTLDYTNVALSAQKILCEIQTGKVAQYERENVELREKVASGENEIQLKERILELENAIKEDVGEKNVVVNAFNLYISKVQKMVIDIFEEKPRNAFSDCRRLEDCNPPPSSLIPFESVKPNVPNEAESNDTVNVQRPNINNDSNFGGNMAAARLETQTICNPIKSEKPSPCKNQNMEAATGEDSLNLKRKVVEDHDDSSSDSVVLISYDSENTENQRKKKTKLV